MAVSKASVLNAFDWFKELQDSTNEKKFVAQEEGKGLSTNDFTDEDKEKLDELENYELPTASRWEKGGVRILPDSGLEMSGDALIVTVQGGGGTGDYQLQTASKTQKGGIKIGDGLEMQGDTLNCTVSSGTLDLVTQSTNGLMRATDKVRLDNMEDNAQENVIESIWVDNTPQIVQDKIAKLDLTSFATKSQVASGIRMKGSVNSFADLPTDAEAGDLYNIKTAGGVDGEGIAIEAGDNVIRTDKGTWDVMAGFIDLSDFAKKTDLAGAMSAIYSLSSTVKNFHNYDLPTATTERLGGIIVGNGLEVKNDGTLNCIVKGETYSEFTGATATAGGSKGLVPAPSADDNKKFLCDDGSWKKASELVTVVIGGGSATATSDVNIQGALWQDIINGVPCLKLRYGDYEYNFYYDTLNQTGGTATPLDTSPGMIYTLDIKPSSKDGDLWYEVTDNHPKLMMHKWAFNYGFNYDTITYKGDNSYLYSYMPFEVTTADACNNKAWTNSGATIALATWGGNALKNTGKLNCAVKGIMARVYTIDFWLYLDTETFPTDNVNYSFLTINVSSSANTHPASRSLAIKNGKLFGSTTEIGDIIKKQRSHIAITKTSGGNAHKVYINGRYVADWKAFTAISNELSDGLRQIEFFGNFENHAFPMYIDHFRMFKDQVVWESDFTPPVVEDYLK